MELLVTGLLTLARCEANREPGISEPVIISHLVGEIWAPLAEKASMKKLAVTFDIPAQIELGTEPTMFRAILAILLEKGGSIGRRIGAATDDEEIFQQKNSPRRFRGCVEFPVPRSRKSFLHVRDHAGRSLARTRLTQAGGAGSLVPITFSPIHTRRSR